MYGVRPIIRRVRGYRAVLLYGNVRIRSGSDNPRRACTDGAITERRVDPTRGLRKTDGAEYRARLQPMRLGRGRTSEATRIAAADLSNDLRRRRKDRNARAR